MYICITVEVPFLNKAFDFRIPKIMKVADAIELICDIIKTNYQELNLDVDSTELLSITSFQSVIFGITSAKQKPLVSLCLRFAQKLSIVNYKLFTTIFSVLSPILII